MTTTLYAICQNCRKVSEVVQIRNIAVRCAHCETKVGPIAKLSKPDRTPANKVRPGLLPKETVRGIFLMAGTSGEIAERYKVSVVEVYRIKMREIYQRVTDDLVQG